MVGLSAAQLAPMKLNAGDTITYHTQMTAIVPRVDDSPGEEYPICVSTDEMIPQTMMMTAARLGHVQHQQEQLAAKTSEYLQAQHDRQSAQLEQQQEMKKQMEEHRQYLEE
eukprot:jgi/Phyca11/21994/fgenesh1_pg.PHYCAscaffold_350_\